MPSLQDKICNALTLAGLLGVIAFGTASLWPDAKADTAEFAPTVEEADTMQLDTLEELPFIEGLPATSEKPADTLNADTLSALPTETADSVSHTPVNIMDSEETATDKKRAEKEDVEKTEPSKQSEQETIMD